MTTNHIEEFLFLPPLFHHHSTICLGNPKKLRRHATLFDSWRTTTTSTSGGGTRKKKIKINSFEALKPNLRPNVRTQFEWLLTSGSFVWICSFKFVDELTNGVAHRRPFNRQPVFPFHGRRTRPTITGRS